MAISVAWWSSLRLGEAALHGIGLAIVAMSSPLLTIESRRTGQLCTQAYSWGVAEGPMRSESAIETTGTRVTFVLPKEAPAIDDEDFLEQIEIWRVAHPGLPIDIQVSA
jgi:DNA gyrase/topoisomerase IV subunit B